MPWRDVLSFFAGFLQCTLVASDLAYAAVNWYNNLSTGQLNSVCLSASQTVGGRCEDEHSESLYLHQKADIISSAFVLPGAIVFVLMVSQSHCNCIHFHSAAFITYQRLKMEFVLLRLIMDNDMRS